MKLIIDIPYEAYYTFKCDLKKGNLNALAKIVANGVPYEERPQGDLIKAFELLKAHCKNRECNKDCVFYRELRLGDSTEQFCKLCEIVMSDDKEADNEQI